MGSDEMWQLGEEALVKALNQIGLDYTRQEGEAAFYGPKIDIKLVDAIGNAWQATTVQFDFNLPERFNITYTGSDSSEHKVIMIHRAILGSLERFIGTLLEHFGGAFPLWLAPTQTVVIPISEKSLEYATEIHKAFKKLRFRSELDDRNEKMNYKIRDAQERKIPFMLIVGEKEKELRTVSVRSRDVGDIGSATVSQISEMFDHLTKNKSNYFIDEWNTHKGTIESWLDLKNTK
jgi:threonyl-tRNA synthetase